MTKQDIEAAKSFEELHANVLSFFSELVAELGGDSEKLLHQIGISAEQAPITYRQLVGLLELAAAHLHCPDFGMRLAVRQKIIPSYGPLGAVMKNSKTYGDALNYVSSHAYAHSLAAQVRLTRLGSEQGIFAAHDILIDGMPDKSQAIEQILLLGQLGASELTGGYAKARKVHFRHQPVSPLRLYRRYFGCEVCFGQDEDGLFYSDSDVACPVIDNDAEAYEIAISFIDEEFARQRPPIHAEVRGVILRFLGAKECTREDAAAELNLHLRTLHRRLAAEGTSFQKIKDELRRDLMLYYLTRTALSFARITEKLGFAEQAILTRTCQRWFNRTPTMLRREGH